MSDPSTFAIDVLAGRRLVRLIVEDDITYSFRVRAGELDDRLDYLVNCQACSSVWVAFALRLLPRWVRYALAISEATILVGSVWRRLERMEP